MRTLIAGLPKTGTTALLYLIESSLENVEISFEPRSFQVLLSQRFGDFLTKIVYTHQEDCNLQRFLSEFSAFDKRIWIARDPRDQIISAFLYSWYKPHGMPEDRFRLALDFVCRKEAGENISLSSIMKTVYGKYGYFHNPSYYPEQVTPFFRNEKNGFYLYRYRDLIDQKYEALGEYLSCNISGQYQVPKEFKRIARTKSYGNWRAWFEEEDIDCFRPIFSEYMNLTGIPDDWELSAEPINPALNSEYMLRLHEGPRAFL
ncbi:MAG: hypothetical protein AAF921_01315 [Cyanobacteria bacterium P01_D01_bin.44]